MTRRPTLLDDGGKVGREIYGTRPFSSIRIEDDTIGGPTDDAMSRSSTDTVGSLEIPETPTATGE